MVAPVADERGIALQRLEVIRHLRIEVRFDLKDLAEVLIQLVQQVVDLPVADHDDLDFGRNRTRAHACNRHQAVLNAQILNAALLVLDGENIAGIFSERDFVHGVAEKERCIVNTTVIEYMTPKVITVSPDQTIEDCMQLMTKEHFRHLPVVENGKLAGLISIGDIVKEIISTERSRAAMLENYIEGRGYVQ